MRGGDDFAEDRLPRDKPEAGAVDGACGVFAHHEKTVWRDDAVVIVKEMLCWTTTNCCNRRQSVVGSEVISSWLRVYWSTSE